MTNTQTHIHHRSSDTAMNQLFADLRREQSRQRIPNCLHAVHPEIADALLDESEYTNS